MVHSVEHSLRIRLSCLVTNMLIEELCQFSSQKRDCIHVVDEYHDSVLIPWLHQWRFVGFQTLHVSAHLDECLLLMVSHQHIQLQFVPQWVLGVVPQHLEVGADEILRQGLINRVLARLTQQHLQVQVAHILRLSYHSQQILLHLLPWVLNVYSNHVYLFLQVRNGLVIDSHVKLVAVCRVD